jgi:hypothetical protein
MNRWELKLIGALALLVAGSEYRDLALKGLIRLLRLTDTESDEMRESTHHEE